MRRLLSIITISFVIIIFFVIVKFTCDRTPVLAQGNVTSPPTVYVANSYFIFTASGVIDTASVINRQDNTVTDVTLGTNNTLELPQAVAVTPDGRFAYVAISNSTPQGGLANGEVKVVDTVSNAVTSIIPVGIAPDAIAITPDGKLAYVVNRGDGSVSSVGDVSVINTANNAVISPSITICPSTAQGTCAPVDIAITPDGKFAYVSSRVGGINSTSNVTIIDIASNAVVATLTPTSTSGGVPGDPHLAITPNGAKAYLGNVVQSDPISVIDVPSKSIVGSVPVPTGGVVEGLATSADGSFVYAAVNIVAGGFVQSSEIEVIRTSDNTVISPPITGGLADVNRIAVAPEGLAYVSSSDGITVIDTKVNKVVTTIPSSNSSFSQPTGIAVTPVNISILPVAAEILTGNTQSFAATDLHDSGVTWVVNGIPGGDVTVGTITPATCSTATSSVCNAVYTAPTTGQSTTVAAVSNLDPTKIATATVTISAPPVISLTPTTATLSTGASQQFTASVSGTTNTGITWTLSGTGCSGNTCGTITAGGLYTAPQAVPSSTVTVTATSVFDSTVTATATVDVYGAARCCVGQLPQPPPSSIHAGQSIVVGMGLSGVPAQSTVPFALSCTGLPAGAGCAFAAPALKGGMPIQSMSGASPTAIVTIFTTGPGSALVKPEPDRPLIPAIQFCTLFIFALSLLIIALQIRAGTRKRYALECFVGLCAVVIFLASCNGFSRSSVSVPSGNMTQAGHYTIHILASPPAGSGFVQVELIVPLTIN